MQCGLTFVGKAEQKLSDAEGIVETHFPTGHLPVPGDRVTLRVTPGKVPMEFVCKARHFDFSEGTECRLSIELDLA